MSGFYSSSSSNGWARIVSGEWDMSSAATQHVFDALKIEYRMAFAVTAPKAVYKTPIAVTLPLSMQPSRFDRDITWTIGTE